jgi:hypothetical protein
VSSPAFGDPRLDEIFRYWLSKRRDGKPPRRTDIRPADLGAAVRHVNLVEVVRAPGRPLQFRHRLIGTHNIEWLGRDMTGRMLDESLYGAGAPAIIAGFTRIVEEAQPYHRRNRMDWNNQKFLLHESVDLPLADENHAVAMILRGAVFQMVDGGGAKDLFEPIAV